MLRYESRRVNTLNYYADVAELVDAPVLGTGIVMVWGFESLHPHQNSEIARTHETVLVMRQWRLLFLTQRRG